MDGVAGLFDDVVGGDWQLIALGDDPLIDVSPELRDWFGSIGGTATMVGDEGPIRDLDHAYRDWFAAHACSVVLSRPDFYIYGTGTLHDTPRLLQSLRDELSKEGALQ